MSTYSRYPESSLSNFYKHIDWAHYFASRVLINSVKNWFLKVSRMCVI